MHIIAVVGMSGSGKSELSKFFAKRHFQIIRFGDITDEELKRRGLEINEHNERKIRETLRQEHGMAAYAKLNLDRIRDALKKGPVVCDGLYSWEEYLQLKDVFKDQLVVLAVYSPPETRYERLDDREVRSLTREQAVSRDRSEIEKLNKAAPIAMADYTLLNVGTLFDLENNLIKFLEWLHEKDETELE